MAEMPIEPDYNRFIPPIVDETLEEAKDDDWEEEPSDLIENEDGSFTILDEEEDPVERIFGENLAEYLDNAALTRIASDFIDLIDKDKEARKRRDEQYEEGIRRTGLGDDAPGGATFSGASKVVHPVLAEGCVDFAARAIKELCPPNGPVRTQILGKNTGQKLQRANRKREFLNWQLTKQSPEFFTELEQTLSQLPLGGSQYIKILPNFDEKRPEFEFVPVDKLLLPFAATNFYTAQRVTHIQELTEQTFEDRINSGYYRDVSLSAPGTVPEETKSQKASNKVEGKDYTAYNEDGLRTVYEVTCYYKVPEDEQTGGKLAPYVLSIDEHTNTVLSIYRNWEEKDENRNKLDWLVEFKFIPWRGAYGIGLPHLIGGLAAALTGALRALMDSAHVNNAPTALKLKGARLSGQTQQVEITQIQEIEGVPGTDDIRKIIMPMPFNQPSQVLFNLLDWLTAASKGVVATAEEKISDASNQMPVGTALALIEQGSINYSAIHMRLHHSMAKLLEIVQRINYDLLDEQLVLEDFGDEIIYREDFRHSSDVVPVSDPNIFSESQRYAQTQALMQLQQIEPDMYNAYEIHRRALEQLKIQDIDDVLPPKQKPREMNAVAENVTAMLGNPLMVFPEQDHLSHIEAHLRFATDPNFGGSAVAAPKVIPAIMEHVNNHLAFLYAQTCNEVANSAIPLGPDNIDVKQMDQVLAAVTAKVSAVTPQIMAPVQQMLAQAQQLLAQHMPQPPLDPAVQVQKEIGMAEIQRQKEKDQGDLQIKAQDQQQKLQETSAKMQAELQQKQEENAREVEKLRQEADRIKTEAAGLLQKAATEQQKLELQRQKQEIDAQLRMAELDRRDLELQQKQFEMEQRLMQEATIESPDHEAQEEQAISQIMQVQQEILAQLAELKSQPKEDTSSAALLETLKQIVEAQNAPKMLIKDAQGRPVGMAPIPKGERLQ